LGVALRVLGLRFHEKANECRHLEMIRDFSKKFYLASLDLVRFNSRLLPESHFRNLVILVGDENVADAGSCTLDGAHVSDAENHEVGVSEWNSFLRNQDQPSSLSRSEVEEVGESGRRTGLDLRFAESRSLTSLGGTAELRRRHVGEGSGSSALDGSRRVGHDELQERAPRAGTADENEELRSLAAIYAARRAQFALEKARIATTSHLQSGLTLTVRRSHL